MRSASHGDPSPLRLPQDDDGFVGQLQHDPAGDLGADAGNLRECLAVAGVLGDDDAGQITCLRPNIVVLKTPDAQNVNAGDPLTFAIVVNNTGQGVARALLLVPAGLTRQWQGELRENGRAGGAAAEVRPGLRLALPYGAVAGRVLRAPRPGRELRPRLHAVPEREGRRGDDEGAELVADLDVEELVGSERAGEGGEGADDRLDDDAGGRAAADLLAGTRADAEVQPVPLKAMNTPEGMRTALPNAV